MYDSGMLSCFRELLVAAAAISVKWSRADTTMATLAPYEHNVVGIICVGSLPVSLLNSAHTKYRRLATLPDQSLDNYYGFPEIPWRYGCSL